MDGPYKKNLPLSLPAGRPVQGAGSSFDGAILDRIGHYRRLHPKWGAQTILIELIHQDQYRASDLPACSTLERYFRGLSLLQAYEKHRPLGSNIRIKAEHCHDCWQMDDKGAETYPGIGEVSMINIKDVISGVHVQCFAVLVAHKRCHPNIGDYQSALRLAFVEFGLPRRIQADHGSNFYENRSRSPFPTSLHLWLLGLGVELEWARTYRPTDQAKVERTHQTLHDQIQQSVDFKSFHHFKTLADERRNRLNNYMACRTTGKTPLAAYPQARHSGRYFNPIMENSLFDSAPIRKYLHLKEWFRKVSDARTVSIGGRVYYLSKAKPKTELKIVFDQIENNLIFYDFKERIAQLPLKGAAFQDLVEPAYFKALNNRQFELPFNWKKP